MNKIKVFATIAAAIALVFIFSPPSRSELASKVVKLRGVNGGQCSGSQVRAPSGVSYILTAAHCRPLANAEGLIEVERQDGRKIARKVLAEDDSSDLLLLEGIPGLKGLDIAKSVSRNGERLFSLTHGGGMAIWGSEGETVGELHIDILIGFERCTAKGSKYAYKDIEVGWGIKAPACVLSVDEMVTTLRLIPGSSGGMIVNRWGQLVGVCSSGSSAFTNLVLLQDIRRFIESY